MTRPRRRVLIIVENLPAERDSRVRRESQALVQVGYQVTVISPRATGVDVPPELEGVRLLHYPPPPQWRGKLGFAYEFAYSWVVIAALTVRAAVTGGFDVIQACNPPETLFALAVPFKLLGKAFVFDHHDLSPEHYEVQFGRRDLLHRALLALERATFATADHVIATNESARSVALGRGGKLPHDVTVVRNGPPLGLLGRPRPRPELKHGRRFLACWVGVMRGFDDGVDLALRAIHHLVYDRGRRDCHTVFVGDGEMLAPMRLLADELDLEEFVTFAGWLPLEEVFEHLATADVALQSNPKNVRTDTATAIKTVEYMAFGLPVVAFDLRETRVSAGDAAVYAESNDVASFARLLDELLDDPERREVMGAEGLRRVVDELAWDHQEKRYVAVFDDLVRRRCAGSST